MQTKYALIIVAFIVLTFSMVQPIYSGTWRDDFEDNDTREWKIFNLVRQIEKWWINDNEAVGEIFEINSMSLWLTGDIQWKHYSLSCRAKLVLDREAPPSIGLTLHDRAEEDSRYLFFVDFDLSIVRITRSVLDEWTNVPFFFAAERDTWYQLTATVYEGGILEFQIENLESEVAEKPKVFIAIDPDPLDGGQAGLVVANARARFDDVVITGDNIPNGGPGKPHDVKPHAKLATTWAKLKTQ